MRGLYLIIVEGRVVICFCCRREGVRRRHGCGGVARGWARGGCGPGTDFPYLFVYDLPSRYQSRGRLATAGDDSNFTFSAFPFGRLFGTWMYDVASIYVERALAYRCRTLEPYQALVRRYLPSERRKHPAHFDAHARVTLVVALSDRGDYDGGYYL